MQYVALLRGINVGGKNKLPMADLRALLTELGASDVATYIQSGNVVFDAKGATPTWSKKISAAISRHAGFEPEVMVLKAADYNRVIEGYPFAGPGDRPTNHHIMFLAKAPKAFAAEKAEALKRPGEAYKVTGDAAYLQVADGLSKSKLAAAFPRLLGVPATSRNWRSVQKIAAMLR